MNRACFQFHSGGGDESCTCTLAGTTNVKRYRRNLPLSALGDKKEARGEDATDDNLKTPPFFPCDRRFETTATVILPGGFKAGCGRRWRAGAVLTRPPDANSCQRPPRCAVRGRMEIFPGAASEQREPLRERDSWHGVCVAQTVSRGFQKMKKAGVFWSIPPFPIQRTPPPPCVSVILWESVVWRSDATV